MTTDELPEDLKKVEKVMTDTRTVALHIQIGELWLIVTTLQLAHRHPEISEPMKSLIENFTRQISTPLLMAHPQVSEILEKGWNEDFDVSADEDKDND